MLETIILYLNQQLSISPYFQKTFGIIEMLKDSKGKESPKEYCTGGEWKEVSNFDNFNGVSYWRKRGEVTSDEFDSDISCSKFLRINTPLRLVACIPKKKGKKDDGYSDDRIFNDLLKILHTSSAYLKSALSARRVSVSVSGYETNNQTVFNDEYKNVSAKDINFKYSYLRIDINVIVEIRKDCIQDSCVTPDSCDILIKSLSTAQKLECLLPDYDFSNGNVFAALTTEQIDILTGLLCTACANVTVYKSDGLTVVSVVASGGSYTIPKHTIFKSNGITVVSQDEFDTNYTTPLVTITNSVAAIKYQKEAGETQAIPQHTVYKSDGGTPYGSDEFDVNRVIPAVTINDAITGNTTKDGGDTYTCGLMSAATCLQLNQGLTQAQRQVIQQSNPLKTGQTTSYRTGDDGDYEKGKLVNFYTLNCNNSFGNTSRFTDSLGSQLYGSGNAALTNYVIDHATGIGWFRILSAQTNWNTAIDNAEAFSTHYTDWRMANRNEIMNILDCEITNPLNYSPFYLGAGGTVNLWTSTTCKGSITFAFRFTIAVATASSIGVMGTTLKTDSTINSLYCRNHF